jgi:hypothetical protein
MRVRGMMRELGIEGLTAVVAWERDLFGAHGFFWDFWLN